MLDQNSTVQMDSQGLIQKPEITKDKPRKKCPALDFSEDKCSQDSDSLTRLTKIHEDSGEENLESERTQKELPNQIPKENTEKKLPEMTSQQMNSHIIESLSKINQFIERIEHNISKSRVRTQKFFPKKLAPQ